MTDFAVIEGIYAEPLGCYIFVERRGDLILRVGFSDERPGPPSELAGSVLGHLTGEGERCNLLQEVGRCGLKLDLSSQSAFQLDVSGVVAAIPRGETLTYGDVADRLGRPNAARAVGRALASNPFPIIIPCHRVVAAGGIGGYRWGTGMKARILALEREASAAGGRLTSI